MCNWNAYASKTINMDGRAVEKGKYMMCSNAKLCFSRKESLKRLN